VTRALRGGCRVRSRFVPELVATGAPSFAGERDHRPRTPPGRSARPAVTVYRGCDGRSAGRRANERFARRLLRSSARSRCRPRFGSLDAPNPTGHGATNVLVAGEFSPAARRPRWGVGVGSRGRLEKVAVPLQARCSRRAWEAGSTAIRLARWSSDFEPRRRGFPHASFCVFWRLSSNERPGGGDSSPGARAAARRCSTPRAATECMPTLQRAQTRSRAASRWRRH
jgi:hypothetical protein